ncbi:hypothetical protein JRQ81_012138, partial [Phrynocephalus forsythii]
MHSSDTVSPIEAENDQIEKDVDKNGQRGRPEGADAGGMSWEEIEGDGCSNSRNHPDHFARFRVCHGRSGSHGAFRGNHQRDGGKRGWRVISPSNDGLDPERLRWGSYIWISERTLLSVPHPKTDRGVGLDFCIHSSAQDRSGCLGHSHTTNASALIGRTFPPGLVWFKPALSLCPFNLKAARRLPIIFVYRAFFRGMRQETPVRGFWGVCSVVVVPGTFRDVTGGSSETQKAPSDNWRFHPVQGAPEKADRGIEPASGRYFDSSLSSPRMETAAASPAQ